MNIKDKQAILKKDLEDMEKELAMWVGFMAINQGNFTPAQVAGCLRRAKQLVTELLFADQD